MWLFDLQWHHKFAGAILIALALFHALMYRRFGWKTELQSVSLLTRQIFYVHTFFIALVVGLNGLLSLFYARELLGSGALSRLILGGITIFWACRWACQFWVYDARLWRGKAFETLVHWAFALLWTYLTLLYGISWWCAGNY